MDDLMSLFWRYLPGILQTVGAGVCLWLWWSVKRVFVTRADCEACRKSAYSHLEERLEAVEKRQNGRTTALQKIESKIDDLPTSDEFRDLSVSLKEVEGDIKGIRAQIDGLEHVIGRLERAVDMFQEVHMR